ncbi:ABC transporter ATP-binding protein [bacterium]|nr:ABC transporter ATP-binding protein [bacterium]
MIKLLDIEKYYTNGYIKTYVLRGINLEVEEGEFLTIMGPSGAGKSTLLHILGMLDSPSNGDYLFYDTPVQRLREKQKSELHKNHIGFVFQSYHLIDELTVYENLETPLLYKKIKGSERKARVADVLDRFQIVAKKDLFPYQLSGGQQQLVGVARAVISEPKLILADEPTGNLNSAQGKEIMGMLKKLNKEGVTIIQVTHSEEKAKYGNRTIHLLDGWVEKEDQN